MDVLDAGHRYGLTIYDDMDAFPQQIVFMKREGEGYPGNVGHYPGTNCQEVLRALIDRVKYLENQISHPCNDIILRCLREALIAFEIRAAMRHGRTLQQTCGLYIEEEPHCPKCGHIGCEHVAPQP